MTMDISRVFPLGARHLPDTPAVRAALANIDALRNAAAPRGATVSERALIARINRKLACVPSPMRMRVLSERSRWYNNLGRFYVIEVRFNRVDQVHVDLEGYGRELEVLSVMEVVA